MADDEAGGGQGISFGLEHIADDLGDALQLHGHIVQVPVSHDLLDGAFNLPDIVGHIDGDVVADVVIELQIQAPALFFRMAIRVS